MNDSLNIVIGIAGLVIGIGIGAVGHMMLGQGRARYRKMLAERDEELDRMREHLRKHLTQATEMAEQLHSHSAQLNQLLAEETELLKDDTELRRRIRLLNGQAASVQDEEEEALALSAPRDYADGNAVSEQRETREPISATLDAPQAPRY